VGWGGCGAIVAAQGSNVWGVLFNIGLRDLANLDSAEGFRYKRTEHQVKIIGGVEYTAFMYEVIHKARSKPPSRAYIDKIKKRAQEAHLHRKYLDFLNSIKTNRNEN
jgi:gamma-glutamylcyclotransferase (GGCT)/AIG2-like uncharacterized protein YtfP